MTSKVTVSKGLLTALAGTAVLALVGLVFLLGRASAPSAPPASPLTAPAGEARPLPAPLTAPDPGVLPVPTPLAAGVATTSVPVSPSLPAAPRADGERQAVLAYFRALDALQPEGKGDPEQKAQEVVAGFAKGDTSSFDGMDRQAQTARNRLAALTPPAPCTTFHQDSLALMDAGLDLMRGIRKAMASPEAASGLGDLTERANALKARTDTLKAQENALRSRYR